MSKLFEVRISDKNMMICENVKILRFFVTIHDIFCVLRQESPLERVEGSECEYPTRWPAAITCLYMWCTVTILWVGCLLLYRTHAASRYR